MSQRSHLWKLEEPSLNRGALWVDTSCHLQCSPGIPPLKVLQCHVMTRMIHTTLIMQITTNTFSKLAQYITLGFPPVNLKLKKLLGYEVKLLHKTKGSPFVVGFFNQSIHLVQGITFPFHLSLCSSSTWCCLHCLKVNSLQDVLCQECELPRMDSFNTKADESEPKPGWSGTRVNLLFFPPRFHLDFKISANFIKLLHFGFLMPRITGIYLPEGNFWKGLWS